MQEDYWKAFYATGEAPNPPSPFCEFVLSKNIPGTSVVDVGCGNGRDSEKLAERYQVTGIDPAAPASEGKRAQYKQQVLEESLDLLQSADIVYSRFFLHAAEPSAISFMFDAAQGYVCAEARAKGDTPLLYPDHERNYVDGTELINAALAAGHEVLFSEHGRGLAVYKNEDPLIVRIITRKVK